MRPSIAVETKIDEIRAAVARHGLRNPRLFGSVARGEDVEGSDIDLLVDPGETTTLMDLARLKLELERLLGVNVDIATPGALSGRLAREVANDAKPL
jgi:predicted nucleotidyltransferase